MRYAFAAVLMLLPLLAPMPAQAEDKPLLDAATCRQLSVEYQPPADIAQNAEYVDGVDAQGKPVVEADLNPSGVTVPQVVDFNISVLQARWLGLKSPAVQKAEAIIGRVSVDMKTGRVSYNGQPIGRGVDLDALRDLCPTADAPADAAADIKNPKGVEDIKNPDGVADIKNPDGADIKNPGGTSDIKNPAGIDVKTGKP